jgi:hypothetical protein
MAGDPYEFMRWAGWKSEEVAETFTGGPRTRYKSWLTTTSLS